MIEEDDYDFDFKYSGDPAQDIPRLIKWRGDGLSFVELLRYLPYLKGDCAITWEYENVIVWQGVSATCVEVMRKLLGEQQIIVQNTMPLTYFIDGVVPKLPLARKLRNYKKPRWMPMTLSLTRSGRDKIAA